MAKETTTESVLTPAEGIVLMPAGSSALPVFVIEKESGGCSCGGGCKCGCQSGGSCGCGGCG
jgi:hypothetical protein